MVSGPPSALLLFLRFRRQNRLPLPAVGAVITPLHNRCVAFAFGIPPFLGTQSRTLEASLHRLFSLVCKTRVKSGEVHFGSCWVCFFPPLPWVKVLTANRLGDEECISTSRARSRRTRFASLLCSTEKQNRSLIAVG